MDLERWLEKCGKTRGALRRRLLRDRHFGKGGHNTRSFETSKQKAQTQRAKDRVLERESSVLFDVGVTDFEVSRHDPLSPDTHRN